MSARVLVAGAGAIGQWLGSRLHGCGHDVTLLARKPMAEAIQRRLVVHGHSSFDGPLRCITSVKGGPYDAIFLTPKAYATASLAQAVAPALAPDGVLASMQNGLGNGEKVAAIVGADRTAVCLTSHGVTLEGPGRIHHAGTGPTKVGPAPEATPARARAAHLLLTEAGLDPQWVDVVRGHVWHKAIVNAAINPVGAIWGVRNGDILDQDDLRGLSHRLAEEATDLARSARVELPPGDPGATVDEVLAGTADNLCSMLQDVRARRATEAEQITGRMVRLAERLLVAMPRSESIYGRVKQIEAGYLGARASERLAWDELRHSATPV